MDFVNKYGWKIHSQNNEEGVIEEALKRIDKSVGIAIEFGAPNETFCSNTYFLKERGWVCHFYDINPQSPNVEKREITKENINDLPKCNVLSIDTDGHDYGLWKAYKGKPAIVIIEIDSSLNPEVDDVNNDGGVSFKLMLELGWSKQYFLLAHTGNMIFVDATYTKLFPDINHEDQYELFNRSWL